MWARGYCIGSIGIRWAVRLFLPLFLLFGLAGPSRAGQELPRKILALYNSEAGETPLENNFVYDACQMVMNYYGLPTDYRDVNQRPLPDDKEMAGYRGVITAFSRPVMKKPEEYLRWVIRQVQAGRKLVLLGGFHTLTDPDGIRAPEKTVDEAYRQLGLVYQGDETQNKALIRYVFKDRDFVEFERPYPPLAQAYLKIVPSNASVRSLLTLKRTDHPDSLSTVIMTGPAGGLAWEDYVYWQDPVTFRKQWYLNPFRFLGESLGINGLPVPDPTTLNGLRVAISHIDADGFSGISRINKKSLCAEIIRDEILKHYDFPVTVSVITGEIDPGALGNKRLVGLAREIFALPNVEPASHSHSHPFYWDPQFRHKDRYDHQYGLLIPGYTHDSKIEIDYSVGYVSRELSPPGKPCRVFLWSGNCEPLESDIARCDALGLLNMNGGDTVYDEIENSYTSVGPLYRRVGRRFQVHTGQANENIMTNLWQGPYQGFRNIITTMERTDSPRRIAPLDIYYHFYSAEYKASLKALKQVYEWALNQDIAPMFASEYIKMVRGSLGVALYQPDQERFVIENYQDCLTVRFDRQDVVPDLTRSENVLGYAREPQGLYVSLVPGENRAVIALALKGVSRPGRPFIQKASGWVSDFKQGSKTISLRYKGFDRGRMEVAGLQPDRVYNLRGTALGKPLSLRTNETGVLFVKGIRTGRLEVSWP